MTTVSWRVPKTGNRALYWTLYSLAWAAMAAPLAYDLWSGQRGSDHLREQANVDMGRWATRFLIAALAIRPLAQALRMPVLLRYRRMVGLFAFAYTLAHSLDYLLYAQFWDIPWRVWLRRPYLWVGIAATLLTFPLAASSLDAVRRRMGPAEWRGLHRSLYAIMVLVVLHALWEGGAVDYTQSYICAGLLLLLLIARLPTGQRLILKLQPPRGGVAAAAKGNTRRLAS